MIWLTEGKRKDRPPPLRHNSKKHQEAVLLVCRVRGKGQEAAGRNHHLSYLLLGVHQCTNLPLLLLLAAVPWIIFGYYALVRHTGFSLVLDRHTLAKLAKTGKNMQLPFPFKLNMTKI